MGHLFLLPDICEPPKAKSQTEASYQDKQTAASAPSSSMSSFRGTNSRRTPSTRTETTIAIGYASLKDDEDDPTATPFEPGESTARKAIKKAKKKTTKKKKPSDFFNSWTVPSLGPVEDNEPPLREAVDEDYPF